jgi:hypothetical protein
VRDAHRNAYFQARNMSKNGATNIKMKIIVFFTLLHSTPPKWNDPPPRARLCQI